MYNTYVRRIFSPTSKISTAGFDEAASVGQAQIGQHMWGTPMFAGAYCFGGCPKSWLGFLGKSPRIRVTWMIYRGVKS